MKKRYIDFVPTKGKKSAEGSIKVASYDEVSSDGKVSSGGEVSSRAKLASGVASRAILQKKANSPKKTAAPKKTPKKTPVNPLVEDDVDVEKIFAERKQPAGVSRNGAKFGVIEDYQPKFVRAEVEKRPLGHQGKTKDEPKTDETSKTVKSNVAKPATPKPATSKPATKSATIKFATKPVAAVKPATRPTVIRPVQKATPAKPVVKPATGIKSGTTRPVTGVGKIAFVNTSKIEKRPLSRSAYVKKPVVLPEEKPSKPVKIIDKPEKDSKAGLIIAIILTIILGAAAGTVAFLLLPK